MQGHTISGNTIEIEASKDYYDGGTRKRWYWSKVYITMNGHKMDIDDLSDRNQEHIIEQLPYL